MRTFLREFKKFIMRGNVIDMSVGVIVGGAFTAIVNGLTDHILRPVINWLLVSILGSDSLTGIYTYLKKVEIKELDANGLETGNMIIDLTESIYIDWGAFINAIINFLIIAFVLFLIVRLFNRINEAGKRMTDLKAHIAFKQEKGLKLTKKEIKFLKEEKEIQHSIFPKIEVQFVVFKHNENETETIKLLAKKWGANAVTIKSAQIYDYKEKAKIIPSKQKYSRYIQKNGIWQLKKKIKNKCFRSWAGVVVNSEGEVLPCCFDKQSKFVFGNVQHSSIKEIFHNAEATKFRQQIKENRKIFDICTNCTE